MGVGNETAKGLDGLINVEGGGFNSLLVDGGMGEGRPALEFVVELVGGAAAFKGISTGAAPAAGKGLPTIGLAAVVGRVGGGSGWSVITDILL